MRVDANGKIYKYPLSKNSEYSFEGPLGKTKILVENSKVRILESPCPNHTCMAQGWGTTHVCLPNKIIVTVEQDGGLDAISE